MNPKQTFKVVFILALIEIILVWGIVFVDYPQKWNAIKLNMSDHEVVKVLGMPDNFGSHDMKGPIWRESTSWGEWEFHLLYSHNGVDSIDLKMRFGKNRSDQVVILLKRNKSYIDGLCHDVWKYVRRFAR